jgi:hypothetical protein
MYKIGDTVWVTRVGQQPVTKPCPICFGKLTVTLIFGNGDECILPCSYCALGYDPPKGTVEEYEYIAEAEPRTITGTETSVSEGGEKATYRSGHWSMEKVYATKEEALEEAVAHKDEYEKDQLTRAEYIKKDKNKSYSWNAGYHLRNAKRMRREIEYHEKMAVICKSRAKGD